MKKVWNGFYEQNVINDELQKVDFTITVDIENGSFIGKVYEYDFSVLTGDLVDIKGFIEGELISFVLKYPYMFSYDNEGNSIFDKNEKGHEVIYEGYFQAETGCWEGEWEIELERTNVSKESYHSEVIYGKWEMKTA